MNLIDLSIRRPVFISMVTIFLISLGLLALRVLPVDLYPSVTYPVLVVRAELPGAAPEEVEQMVTRRIEDALSTLSGLNTLRSNSRAGQATVFMEFDMGTDIRFQEIQVRGKVSNLRRSLPETMGEPTIFRQDPDDTPIMEIALTGNRSASEMTRLAETVIMKKLQQLPGVGGVDLSGDRKPEILVELDPIALETWGINAVDVGQALHRANRNDPTGKLEGKERAWIVRSMAGAKNVQDLGGITIARSAGSHPILLRDIATISSGFEERRRASFFANAESLRPAILLSVLKQSGENTVAVSARLRAALGDIGPLLPPDVSMVVTMDNAELVLSNVHDVYESLGFGAVFTVIVVLLFLGSLRATLTTGLSLPSSIITTFACLFVAGFTVNVMTLLALSLAVGLLVDDAIVVRENIFRHLRTCGPLEAAAKGAKEVSLAVVATTLVIVAVFLPVGFMGGVSGQFFKQFALTVVFAVLISLWDALTMAPMLSAYFANIPDPAREWEPFGGFGRSVYGVLKAFDRSFDRLEHRYKGLLAWLLLRPAVAVFLTLLAIAAAGWGFTAVRKSFLPGQLGPVFSASLNGPIAVPLPAVTALVDEVHKRVRDVKGLESWSISSGVGFSGNASINVTLRTAPASAKDQTSLGKIRQDTRKALAGIPGYLVRISEPSDPLAGSSGRFQPIAVIINGDEIQSLVTMARRVRDIMKDVPGIVDVAPVQDEGLPEIQITTDQALAGHFGVAAADVSDNLSVWLSGDTSNSIRVGDDQVPIRIVLKGGTGMRPADLLASNIFVRSGSASRGVAVPLGAIAHWQSGAGPTMINRENRQRTLRVGANLAPGAALGDIVQELQKKLEAEPMPKGYSAKIAGQNEQMKELFLNVVVAILIGILFVYMVLAALFESFVQPLTVMMAIPLAATGAVLALLATNTPLDLYSGVGMILLAGIVAKNSILLVDFALQAVRRDGADPMAALIASAPLRLRPIIMTSVAMIAGMVPIAWGLGSGGEARRSLGIATIGGVLSSTLLTLVVVPSAFLFVQCYLSRRTIPPLTPSVSSSD